MVGYRSDERVRKLRRKEVYNIDYEEVVTEAGITARGRNIVETAGNVVMQGGRFTGSVGSSISGANISFLAVTTQSQHAEEVKKSNVFMDTQISRGNYSKNVKVAEISEGVSINGRGAINVEIEAGKKPAWVSMLESSRNVNITEIARENKSWDKKTRQLTPAATVAVGTLVTAATAGAGSFIGAGVASGIGASAPSIAAGISSGIAAGVSGFASSVVIGSANNGGNVGKGIKSATSKEALKSLGKNMLAAGVISGVMDKTKFGDVASRAKEGGVAGRNQVIFERVILRTGVNTAIIGGDIRDNFRGEALRGALAVGQGYIGDIGERYGLREGGAAKVMMHSALGGTYALASGSNVAIGALAGGVGPFVGSLIGASSTVYAADGYNKAFGKYDHDQ